ncbi:hypothetical protein CKO25_03460 [Thiocapsa imhoffii]|uniref:DUF1826 domain-containing protein n=1 Tax=Thiocapsa imhoffii TaxID=382777 RepID=A0A9X0WFN9_9GAMM|nr:DUF1826 domain-containing protein [Thiocapsa imhoffii]MBK1643733.1 hypothetical protein [Thiocapsa imhoffii]
MEPTIPHPTAMRPVAYAASPLAMQSTRRVDRLADLSEIFESDVLICHHPRRACTRIMDAFAQPVFQSWPGLRAVVPVSSDGIPQIDRLRLPEHPEAAAITAEIRFLTQLYADLIGCPSIGLRVERLDRAMCPKWHVDRTGIRLLCTWRGPGTEWLDAAGIDHRALPTMAGDSPASGRAAPFDLLLLKGTAWPGHAEQRGAIHRSPSVAPEACPRIILALDALWTD